MSYPTEATARDFFADRGTVIYFERVNCGLIRRFEALISTHGRLQIWAWDSSHGCGFWHMIISDAFRA